MIESSLYTYITADVTVSGLIGTRLYPLDLPQQPTAPCVTYHRVSTVPLYALDGDADVDTVRIQIDSYDDTVLGAKTLADAIRARIGGFRGDMSGTTVQAVFLDSEQDFGDPTTDLYRVSQDYLITYER